MPSNRRRLTTRHERQRGLIVTEGTVTEPQYFDLLKQHLPRSWATVTVKGAGKDPLNVLKKCIELRDKAKSRDRGRRDGRPEQAYDWCCCVLDVDEHATLEQCLVEARKNNIEIVVTNRKFEVWLLWHCTDLSGERDGHELDALARKHRALVGKDLATQFPIENYREAAVRARRADPDLASRRIGPNPSSSMPILFDLVAPEDPQG